MARGCDTCHTIRGVLTADATVGPPLTGVALRSIIGGRLPNTPENMVRWIRQPQEISPGTVMPELGLSDQEARDIVAYLYAVR